MPHSSRGVSSGLCCLRVSDFTPPWHLISTSFGLWKPLMESVMRQWEVRARRWEFRAADRRAKRRNGDASRVMAQSAPPALESLDVEDGTLATLPDVANTNTEGTATPEMAAG